VARVDPGGHLRREGGNPRLAGPADQTATGTQPGGNLEGKEVRLGPGGSALLATGTMGTSAGVASSALDSYTPVGGLTALGPILLGEVSPGGVGTGLYAMLVFVLLTVFLAGLMVGRTPEYLGKKLTGQQTTLVALYLLILPLVVLGFSAVSAVLPSALDSRLNPGMHGLTEIVYAFASAANGNGSAFAGLSANTDWYNTTLGLTMLAGCYLTIVPVLALAGSMARVRVEASSPATLATHGPVFVTFHLAVVLLLGGLSYLPMLVLGLVGESITI
jgi:K+-transporting ATPase ATPase A chain